MKRDRLQLKFAAALAAYLIGVGVLGGILLDRWRFDHRRAEVLRRYDAAVRSWKALHMAIDGRMVREDAPDGAPSSRNP
jgi:hypothetical protein